MAGRGAPPAKPPLAKAPSAKQQVQQPGRTLGQGSRPPAQAAKPAAPLVGAGEKAGQDVNRTQSRGWWGDDGVNVYGDGQHRGSSSAGGGRGYAWQGHAGSGPAFSGPPGKFVPGIAGPSYPKRGGYRQKWGGRGGGRNPRPPLPLEEVHEPLATAGGHGQRQPVDSSISLSQPKGMVDAVVAATDKGNSHA
ncbi:hypothetical protein ZWY2020_029084 [Hordeum vulgare]|nr:hypothetical protein ZWY2020_029084 [Hordeum vulgare]